MSSPVLARGSGTSEIVLPVPVAIFISVFSSCWIKYSDNRKQDPLSLPFLPLWYTQML